MTYLSISMALLAGLAVWLLFTSTIAYENTRKFTRNLENYHIHQKITLEDKLEPVIDWVADRIHLSGSKRGQMIKMLRMAGLDTKVSPEKYLAQNIVVSGLFAIAMIALGFVISKVCFILAIVGTYLVYRNRDDYALQMTRIRKAAIERDLPQMVTLTQQNLRYSHDIIDIIEKCRISCGPELRSELEKCLADMKTGNHENALIRMEGRTGSSMFSQVIRGLLGVVQGDSQIAYFETLQDDFLKIEEENLRRVAKDAPDKLNKYKLMLFAAVVALIMTTIVIIMIKDASVLF